MIVIGKAMFRQVRHPQPIAFKAYSLGSRPCYILAADYDLGANGYAYLDKDTARYQYTPGVHTEGNKGNAYRNDGVDIRIDSASAKPYIFSIEDGEWLSYTLHIEQAGHYQLQLDYGSDPKNISAAPANIEILQGNTPLGQMEIPGASPASGFKISQAVNIQLSNANNAGPIKLVFKKGGIILRGILIQPQQR